MMFNSITASEAELETKQREIDTCFESMSFGLFSMTKGGLLYVEKEKPPTRICGPFEVLGRARGAL